MRHITSTGGGRPLTVVPFVFAVSLVVLACDDGNPVGPTPLQPGQSAVQSIEIIGAATLQNPGDTARLTATATYSDGTTRDVTTLAGWSVDHRDIVTVAGGVLTARGYGRCYVSASYAGVSARAPVRVVPESMFILSGRVTDETGLPLWPARVSVMPSDSGPGVSTNQAGIYQLPARGHVEARAEMDGFESQARRVDVVDDTTLDFQLRFKAGAFGGMYRLTFVGSPSCSFPAEIMRRTYLARVVAGPSSVTVTLTGADMVAWGEAGFLGTRDGDRVAFVISADYSADYVFVERVGPGKDLAFSGTATGVVGDTFVTTFNGTVDLSGPGGGACRAEDHRLEFTR